MTGAQTRVKGALDLREGDVIVAPDGRHHTVIAWDSLPGNSVVIATDTGLRIHKPWFDAVRDRYDVLTTAPSPTTEGERSPMSEARRMFEALQAARDNTTSALSAAKGHRFRSTAAIRWPHDISALRDLPLAMEWLKYITRDLAEVAQVCADDVRTHYFQDRNPDGDPWPADVTDTARDAGQALSRLRRYLERTPINDSYSALDNLHASVRAAHRTAKQRKGQ